MIRRAFLLVALVACWSCATLAHEVRPAYLELRETAPDTYDVVWKVPGQGEDLRLALYVEMPAGTIEVTPPRASFANNAFAQRWSVKRSNGFAGSTLRVTGLDATLTDALVRVQTLDGNVQVTRLTPATPSFVVDAKPQRLAVAATYLRLGVEHILLGYDHLLFVLALILIVRNRRLLVLTVTAFTLAHSITLALATLGIVHVPGRPVEAVIALSILLLATEIFRVRRGEASLTARWPWAVAFTFGLLHGFGFANALAETGLPHGDIPLALFTFNVGVELGQLAFIGVVIGALALVRRISLPTFVVRRALPTAAYGIGTLSAFWLIGRVAAFWA
jgi:hydrogenase/urease accessory protein HupE